MNANERWEWVCSQFEQLNARISTLEEANKALLEKMESFNKRYTRSTGNESFNEFKWVDKDKEIRKQFEKTQEK